MKGHIFNHMKFFVCDGSEVIGKREPVHCLCYDHIPYVLVYKLSDIFTKLYQNLENLS